MQRPQTEQRLKSSLGCPSPVEAERELVEVDLQVLAPDAMGMVSVAGEDPRSSRPVEDRPEYGDKDQRIADWIASLPRSK